jgi:hypothetical protein
VRLATEEQARMKKGANDDEVHYYKFIEQVHYYLIKYVFDLVENIVNYTYL